MSCASPLIPCSSLFPYLSLHLSFPLWHVSSRSCVETLRTPIHLLLFRHVSFMWISDCHMFCILPHFSHISAKSAYCMFFHINWHFLTAILILFVFLLPISIRFRYLDHLVANRMAPSMCVDPCGTRWGSWFQAVLYRISVAYLAFMRSAYFLIKMPHETDMPDYCYETSSGSGGLIVSVTGCSAVVKMRRSNSWSESYEDFAAADENVSEPAESSSSRNQQDRPVQGCNGAGDGVPAFFSTGGTRLPLSPLFWSDIRAKVSPLLQLVTYWNAV